MKQFVIFCSLALTMGAGVSDSRAAQSWPEKLAAARAAYLQSPEAHPAPSSDTLFQPFDTGPFEGSEPARPVVVNVTGLKEMRLVAQMVKGPANCNIWGEPKLIAKDGTVTKLTALKPTSVNVGWGQLLVDKNWQGSPLIVKDRQFAFGLWVHADSEITFALDGKYERFEAFVGEDKDRTGGQVRFKVLSSPAPLPSVWTEVAREFPLQSGWLRGDAGVDGIGSWFGRRESGALEQEILALVLRDLAPNSPLQTEARELAAKARAGEARWLDLYARACRVRQCVTASKTLENGAGRTALEQELAGMVSGRVPAEDGRWNEWRARAVQAGELDQQFATLQYDLQQRAVLNKATGERVWNGTRYVPTERSTGEEIARQAFQPAALVRESDRDPVDIVLRRTAALLADLKLARFEAPLAKLQKAVAGTPVTDVAARRALHHEIARLRRQIAFANPLLDFKDLVFIKRHRTFYQHMCDQFYGLCQNPGGGLYVLENAFAEKPTVRDVLAGAVCQSGRLKGEKLSGGGVQKADLRYDGQKAISGEDVEGGSFLSPALSPDTKQIAFAYVERRGGKEQIFHEDPTRGH